MVFYSGLCMCWMAAFFKCSMYLISGQTCQTGVGIIAFVVALCLQRERDIVFNSWLKTLKINILLKEKIFNEELVCVRAKISSLLHYFTQFNRLVLGLFSCCSWIDLGYTPHPTQQHGLLGPYKQLHWMTKHCVTLGEATGGWDVMEFAELSFYGNRGWLSHYCTWQ